MVSRIGFARANASSAPPTMKVSVPAVAPPIPPETGASSVSKPAAPPPRALSGGVDVDRRAVDDEGALGRRRKQFGMDGQHMRPAGSMVTTVSAVATASPAFAAMHAGRGGRRLRRSTRSKPVTNDLP